MMLWLALFHDDVVAWKTIHDVQEPAKLQIFLAQWIERSEHVSAGIDGRIAETRNEDFIQSRAPRNPYHRLFAVERVPGKLKIPEIDENLHTHGRCSHGEVWSTKKTGSREAPWACNDRRHVNLTDDVERPRFSWTRIKGESNVQGGGGNGSVEGRGTGRGIGATGVRADDAAAGAGSLAPGQRWSASRKRDVVLRLLRGESLEALSREVGVEIYRLEEWRERAMAGLELGLKDRHGEPVAEVLDAAKRHIGELSMEIELLRERARAAEQRLPLAMRRSRR